MSGALAWVMFTPIRSSALRGGQAEAGRAGLTDGDMDDPLVRIEVDAVMATLVAEAAGLDSAEGRPQVPDVVAVDPGHARLDGTADPVPLGQVAGPDVGCEAVLGVVRE